MQTIKLTVDIEGSYITREYAVNEYVDTDTWGERVNDMLDTIKKSKEVKF